MAPESKLAPKTHPGFSGIRVHSAEGVISGAVVTKSQRCQQGRIKPAFHTSIACGRKTHKPTDDHGGVMGTQAVNLRSALRTQPPTTFLGLYVNWSNPRTQQCFPLWPGPETACRAEIFERIGVPEETGIR